MKKIYFYDDDKINNWNVKNTSAYESWKYRGGPFISEKEKREADKKVKFIHIPVGESGSVDERYLAGGSDELNEANYNAQNSSLNYGWYFPESGVKTSHLKELTSDINHNKVSAIVFDFDKTLQLFEGALMGDSAKSLNEVLGILKTYNFAPMHWSKDDLATFILHDTTDPNRIDNLRTTLQLAESKHIPIFMITNNAIPLNNQQGVMTDLFEFLGVSVPKEFILGGGTSYLRSKYKVILDEVIPEVKNRASRCEQGSKNAICASAGAVVGTYFGGPIGSCVGAACGLGLSRSGYVGGKKRRKTRKRRKTIKRRKTKKRRKRKKRRKTKKRRKRNKKI